MIQLGYYSNSQQAPDESIDFDPNYDPSDFLIKKDTTVEPDVVQIQQQYNEPYDYANNVPEQVSVDEIQQQQNFYGSFANQSFNDNDFSFQQPQQMSQDDYSQQMQQPPLQNDGGGLADLEISDSDDEDEPTEDLSLSQNQADTSKEDDDGLWF